MTEQVVAMSELYRGTMETTPHPGASDPEPEYFEPVAEEEEGEAAGPEVEMLRRALQTKLRGTGTRGLRDCAARCRVDEGIIKAFANSEGGLKWGQYRAVVEVVRESEGA